MNWFPPEIPKDLVPAIRRLGKRGLRYVEFPGGPKELHPGGFVFRNLNDLTMAERRALSRIPPALLNPLAAILADGPKLFEIPPEMVDDLNQIAIPLAVRDYCQPFPACVVRSGDEYHLCLVVEGRPLIVAANNGVTDSIGMLKQDATVEDYLGGSSVWYHGLGGMAKAQDADEVIAPHRFRATLNFLLLLMAGGFQKEPSRQYKQRRKHAGTSKHLVPELYKPQNIKLWQTRLIDANHPKGEGTGSKKSPHWRRAHWRRVAVGKGRVQRELRLIPAVLVNQDHLSVDTAETSYVVKG
jgi:hypothetical protein